MIVTIRIVSASDGESVTDKWSGTATHPPSSNPVSAGVSQAFS